MSLVAQSAGRRYLVLRTARSTLVFASLI